jgi:two-component system cell cycle sensor histidine kinase/response regulator CckA
MPADTNPTPARSSFRAKLFSVFTLLAAVISVLLSTLFILNESKEKKVYLSGNLKQATQQLADSVRLPLYAENITTLRQLAENASRLPEIKAVVITAADGRPLVDLHPSGNTGSEAMLSETAQVLTSQLSTSVEHALTGETTTSPKLIGSVRMDRSTSDLSQALRRLVLYSSGSALLFWLVVTSVFYLILGRFTASFNELMRGLKHMQEGDYTSKIPILSDDEPGRATQAVNELADKLLRRDEENLRLNQDLREREQNLKLLLDVMPVGIAWHNSVGTVEYTNSFITDRFGYVKEDFETMDDLFARFFPDPGYRGHVAGMLRNAARTNEMADDQLMMTEARVTCKDGVVRHVILKSTTEKERTILIVIDITERELLQEQLIKTQKLEAIGILAGGVAHNFNNALTGVLGYINLAAKQIDETSKAALLLENAERATLRAAGMAMQLLTFARGGAPVKRPLSLARLVDESVGMAVNGSMVRPIIQIPGDVRTIMGDADQLSQVFTNLAINAVQSMPDGGTLTVRAQNAVPDATAAPGQPSYVEITFSDTGHGIPEANLTKVFEPYFTTNPSNTGLGLASVQSIVHRHGGRITVTSALGSGTTFNLLLPATDEAPDHEETIGWEIDMPAKGNESVLVMDDEVTIRELVRETLEVLGYRVTACSNGEEAVAEYRAAHESGRPFVAAILDLNVPNGMGGGGSRAADTGFCPGCPADRIKRLFLRPGHVGIQTVRFPGGGDQAVSDR